MVLVAAKYVRTEYNEVSIPNFKAATLKMIILIPRIISVMVNEVLFKYKAPRLQSRLKPHELSLPSQSQFLKKRLQKRRQLMKVSKNIHVKNRLTLKVERQEFCYTVKSPFFTLKLLWFEYYY